MKFCILSAVAAQVAESSFETSLQPVKTLWIAAGMFVTGSEGLYASAKPDSDASQVRGLRLQTWQDICDEYKDMDCATLLNSEKKNLMSQERSECQHYFNMLNRDRRLMGGGPSKFCSDGVDYEFNKYNYEEQLDKARETPKERKEREKVEKQKKEAEKKPISDQLKNEDQIKKDIITDCANMFQKINTNREGQVYNHLKEDLCKELLNRKNGQLMEEMDNMTNKKEQEAAIRQAYKEKLIEREAKRQACEKEKLEKKELEKKELKKKELKKKELEEKYDVNRSDRGDTYRTESDCSYQIVNNTQSDMQHVKP